MNGKRRLWAASSALVLVLVLAGAGNGNAQTKYPNRPINLVVTFSAGGGTDLVGRVASAYASKRWGVPVNILNKPGGKTIPGSYEVFQAPPNGYTLLVSESGTSEFLIVAEKNLPFNPLERVDIGTYAAQAYLLMVAANSPFKTLKDLINEMKTHPENITYTSLGGTTAIELAIRQFFEAVGADVSKAKPIMCSGGADAINLTAGGHVVLASASVASSLPSIMGGTIRPLFIAYKERHPMLPDVPTSAEVGLSSVISTNWYGIAGPPKLQPAVVEAWEGALKDMVKDPEVISQLAKVGGVPFSLNGPENKKLILKNLEDIKKYWR